MTIVYTIIVVYLLYRSTWFGYYLVGMILAELCQKGIWTFQRNYGKYCWIAAALWLVLACVPEKNAAMLVMTNIIGMIFLWLLMGKDRFTGESRWLIWKSYFWIYCGHYLLLETVEKLWHLVGGDHVWCALLDFLLMPLIVLVILESAGTLFQKLCPQIWRVAIGQR